MGIVLGFSAGAAFAGALVYVWQKMRALLKIREMEHAAAQIEKERLGLLAELEAQKRLAEDRQLYFQKTLEQGESRFRELAQKVLEDRERRLKEDGLNPINVIVTELKREIDRLKLSISDSNVKAASTHADLMGKITGLIDQTNKVTAEANNLAGAIRGDSRLTGEWGEIQLRRILDMSGMNETIDYTYQETFREEAGGRKSKRTDVVVKMPGERALIIDSKNTIAAAERFHSAADDDSRSQAAEEIILSVKNHVDEIKAAKYQSFVPNALSTVLMYIPIEEVYMLAMKATVLVGGEREPLRDYARRNNVIFVNSASVVPVVRLVEMMWNVERTEKNRLETIRAAEIVLQRANDFIGEFLAVGDAFREVFSKYEQAKSLLVDAPGAQSLPKAVARLVKLGVQPKTRGGKAYELSSPVRNNV